MNPRPPNHAKSEGRSANPEVAATPEPVQQWSAGPWTIKADGPDGRVDHFHADTDLGSIEVVPLSEAVPREELRRAEADRAEEAALSSHHIRKLRAHRDRLAEALEELTTAIVEYHGETLPGTKTRPYRIHDAIHRGRAALADQPQGCPTCGSDDREGGTVALAGPFGPFGPDADGNYDTEDCPDDFHTASPEQAEGRGEAEEDAPRVARRGEQQDPDPYLCQWCARYFPYLDLMGNPECPDCGGERFWPAPSDRMLLAILARQRRLATQTPPTDREALNPNPSKSVPSIWKCRPLRPPGRREVVARRFVGSIASCARCGSRVLLADLISLSPWGSCCAGCVKAFRPAPTQGTGER